MKKKYFTVGPGQLYPGMERYIKQALDKDILSISHRSSGFSDLFKSTKDSLFHLLTIPTGYHMFLTGSGLESMERVAQNIVAKTATHFIGGSFARKWAQFSQDLGKMVIRIESKEGFGFDLDTLRLPKRAETIFLTVNETSTGVYLNNTFVRALRARYPDSLIAVDMVSAAPYAPIDFKLIDIALFSVQKGFGLPAGMGVIIVSPRAIEKARLLTKKGISTGTYHSFAVMEKMALKYQTPETPNVMSLFLLNKVLESMNKKGIKLIRKEIEQRARLMYDAFDRRADITPFVTEKRFRSPSTIILKTEKDSSLIIKMLGRKGIVLSSGYGPFKKSQIRIANYPAHTEKQFDMLHKMLTARLIQEC